MKLEICESLLQSYLKYTKKCRLTQTNWKFSFLSEQMTEEKKKKLEDIYESNKEDFYSDTSKREQYFKQAEIDVVGYDFYNGHLYLFDTAFHEKGAGYTSNGKRNNVPVILKKCFRSALIGLYFFENIKTLTVSFATPKINSQDQKEIEYKLYDMQTLLQKLHPDIVIHISLIVNEEFAKEILYKTIIDSKKIADTSDLFIRSAKLIGMFDNGSLINKGIINNENDQDNKENNNDTDAKPSKKRTVFFYPNKKEFESDFDQTNSCFVIGVNDQNISIKEDKFSLKSNDNKSSFSNIFLSTDRYRKEARGSVVKYIVYTREVEKNEALKQFIANENSL